VTRAFFKVLRWLPCLLFALAATSAFAHCRPENRVWGFSEKPSNFASQETAKPIDTPGENPDCGYDFASGVHNYLYCKGNPIMGIDPSGQADGDVISLNVSMGTMAGLAAFTGAAVLEAKTHAISKLTQAVATEAMASGASLVETAKSAIQAAGKTLQGLIADAKQIMGQLRNSPVKVIPIPRCVIPAVADHVANAQAFGFPGFPVPLTRCNPAQAKVNRADALAGLGSAFPNSWDEYPFASSWQGGAWTSVRPVPLWQNWVQGGIISACYALEKITYAPPTQYFVVVTP